MESELLKLTKRARTYAFKKGLRRNEEIQDFCQYVAERYIKNTNIRLPFVFVDFTRIQKGDSRTRTLDSRANSIELTNIDVECKKLSPEGMTSLKEAISFLSVNPRVVALLVLIWGFSLKEAGFVLGVSEQRAWQLFQEAKQQLKQKIPIASSKYLEIKQDKKNGGYQNGLSKIW